LAEQIPYLLTRRSRNQKKENSATDETQRGEAPQIWNYKLRIKTQTLLKKHNVVGL
jgi:hypothetical protein